MQNLNKIIQVNLYLQNRNRLTDLENTCMVTRGRMRCSEGYIGSLGLREQYFLIIFNPQEQEHFLHMYTVLCFWPRWKGRIMEYLHENILQIILKYSNSHYHLPLGKTIIFQIYYFVDGVILAVIIQILLTLVMNRGSRHCTGGRDQGHPQEKEMQKSKMAV